MRLASAYSAPRAASAELRVSTRSHTPDEGAAARVRKRSQCHIVHEVALGTLRVRLNHTAMTALAAAMRWAAPSAGGASRRLPTPVPRARRPPGTAGYQPNHGAPWPARYGRSRTKNAAWPGSAHALAIARLVERVANVASSMGPSPLSSHKHTASRRHPVGKTHDSAFSCDGRRSAGNQRRCGCKARGGPGLRFRGRAGPFRRRKDISHGERVDEHGPPQLPQRAHSPRAPWLPPPSRAWGRLAGCAAEERKDHVDPPTARPLGTYDLNGPIHRRATSREGRWTPTSWSSAPGSPACAARSRGRRRRTCEEDGARGHARARWTRSWTRLIDAMNPPADEGEGLPDLRRASGPAPGAHDGLSLLPRGRPQVDAALQPLGRQPAAAMDMDAHRPHDHGQLRGRRRPDPRRGHWYEDPENINGVFPGTHEFLDGPNGKGPDDNPQQDDGKKCANVAVLRLRPVWTSATRRTHSSS